MKVESPKFGSSDRTALVLTEPRAISAIGFNAYQNWAFWRAEANALDSSPFRLENATTATFARMRTLSPTLVGAERLSAIANELVDQIASALTGPLAGVPVSWHLAIPEWLGESGDPYFGPERRRFEIALGERIARRTGGSSALFVEARGHAGLGHALIAARAEIEHHRAEAAIVGGIASYYDPLVIDLAVEEKRLFDGESPDRFIPGEGAAALVVLPERTAKSRGIAPLARVEVVAVADDASTLRVASGATEVPCRGDALTAVYREATDRLRAQRRRLEWVLGDLTNEPYRALEFQLAWPRAIAPGGLDSAGLTFREVAAEEVAFQFLPFAFGDLNAATMAMAAVIASESFARGDPGAANCLISGTSVGRERAAMLLSRV
jgi:3-oxoacyl-[acyl-carrier-protein] synthase-1